MKTNSNSEDSGVIKMEKKGVDKKEGSDVEKSRGKEGVIDWNAVICEGTDDIVVAGKGEGEGGDDKNEEGRKEVQNEGENVKMIVEDGEIEKEDDENDVDDEEEEEDVNSTHFTEMVEVENVFEGVHPLQQEEGEEVGEEEESDDEEEEGEDDSDSEGEEGKEEGEESSKTSTVPSSTSTLIPPATITKVSTNQTTTKTTTNSNTTTTTQSPITSNKIEEKGDINFSEDFFPVLSNAGPKRAKAWPISTNENIGRLSVTAANVVGGNGGDVGDVDGLEINADTNGNDDTNRDVDVQEGEHRNDINATVSAPAAAAAVVAVGVKNWSQVAALSVKAAVITASENKHTVENRYVNLFFLYFRTSLIQILHTISYNKVMSNVVMNE